MFRATDLIRPEIAGLAPYTPILPLDVLAEQLGLPIERLVKLDANENPYGAAPRALEALRNEPYYAIYPDPNHTKLRAALSTFTGQPMERIVCGAGADELIDLLLRLCIAPGDAIIDCPPTFGMYSFDAGVCGGRVLTVPRNADFSLDLEGIEEAAMQGAKILFLTSPNNPTGNLTPHNDIERLLELPLLVVVDEAYIEFSPEANVSSWVGRYDNLAVLRTFSKWAGLAGLRVGYGLLPEWLAEQIWKIKQPYNVNLAAMTAALASLEDVDYLRGNLQRIIVERDRLLPLLAQIPYLEPHPSAANFILCKVLDRDAKDLKTALAQQGILVRHYNTALLRDYIRISIGTPEQSELALTALNNV